MEVKVLTLDGPLEDLFTLLSDEPVGTVDDFDIDVDPDEDLVDSVDDVLDIPPQPSLSHLEPLTIWFLLRDLFGEEWWQLEAGAITAVMGEYMTIEHNDQDLIAGLQLIEVSDVFWREWEVFNWVTSGLAGLGTDFTAFATLEPFDMACALLTAETIKKLTTRTVPEPSLEVQSYIAVTCSEDGLWALPGPLRCAQRRLIELLRPRHLSLPLERAGEVAGAEEPENLPPELASQRARATSMLTKLQDSVNESRREIESYRRRDDK